MKRQPIIQILFALFALGMFMSACTSIDIVKRRYQPGYHVDITKKQHRVKPADNSRAFADKRHIDKAKAIETHQAKAVSSEAEPVLVANVNPTSPVKNSVQKNAKPSKVDQVLKGFSHIDFKRWVRDAKNGVRPDRSAVASDEWMSWVSFGTGLGAMVFGFFALVLGILFGYFWFLWLALMLAGAAITFAILYKKRGGTSSKATLGLIFGIVGGGLAFIALIVWIVYLASAIAYLL